MRLITFQNREILPKLLKNTDKRETIIYRPKEPISCYANINKNGTISINAIVSQWSTLMSTMGFNKDNYCFIELEVNEKDITKFFSTGLKGTNYISDQVKNMLNDPNYKNKEVIEATIPYILKEWIVSYTDYEPLGYAPQVISPVIVNKELFTMYVSSVGLSGDGYFLDINDIDNTDKNSFNNYECKPDDCRKDTLYINCERYLLSHKGIEYYRNYLFGTTARTKYLRDNLKSLTLQELLTIREKIEKPLSDEIVAIEASNKRTNTKSKKGITKMKTNSVNFNLGYSEISMKQSMREVLDIVSKEIYPMRFYPEKVSANHMSLKGRVKVKIVGEGEIFIFLSVIRNGEILKLIEDDLKGKIDGIILCVAPEYFSVEDDAENNGRMRFKYIGTRDLLPKLQRVEDLIEPYYNLKPEIYNKFEFQTTDLGEQNSEDYETSAF